MKRVNVYLGSLLVLLTLIALVFNYNSRVIVADPEVDEGLISYNIATVEMNAYALVR